MFTMILAFVSGLAAALIISATINLRQRKQRAQGLRDSLTRLERGIRLADNDVVCSDGARGHFPKTSPLVNGACERSCLQGDCCRSAKAGTGHLRCFADDEGENEPSAEADRDSIVSRFRRARASAEGTLKGLFGALSLRNG